MKSGSTETVEKSIVRKVAKLAPWLAPVPSAFLVTRSGMVHLDLPLVVAVVVAAITGRNQLQGMAYLKRLSGQQSAASP
jgi:hypothetical protein